MEAKPIEVTVDLYIFPSDPERDPFDIPTSGLVTPSNATQVFNYIEGSITDTPLVTLRSLCRLLRFICLVETACFIMFVYHMSAPITLAKKFPDW